MLPSCATDVNAAFDEVFETQHDVNWMVTFF